MRIYYSSSQRLIKYLPTSINSWCISSIVTGCNSFVLWIDYVNLRSKLSWILLQRQFKKLIVHEICSFLPRTCFNFRLNLGFKNFMQYVSYSSGSVWLLAIFSIYTNFFHFFRAKNDVIIIIYPELKEGSINFKSKVWCKKSE